ncbi:hypothetical protein F2P79_006181 [Pimephales promelas]|nr:hypothetical protein F2P79_006181 [Pimephales promelas]
MERSTSAVFPAPSRALMDVERHRLPQARNCHGYATSLMKALRESYTNSPAALREVSASLSPSPHRHILQTGS